MKTKIFFVDIDVISHYVVQVNATTEDSASRLAKKHVLSGELDAVNEEIDVVDIYETPDEMDNE